MLHKISDEELDNVSGGYIYDTKSISFDERGNGYCRVEVIDDTTGQILHIAKSYSEAFHTAQSLKVSTAEISLDQINKLRETGSL